MPDTSKPCKQNPEQMKALKEAFSEAPSSHYRFKYPVTPKQYKSKKVVTAVECNSDEWLKIRSTLTNYSDASVRGGIDGYRVTYDEGTSNEYHSWSPKEQFEKGYDPI